jgi:DNA-binding beta-propeller fold protein YncE
MRRAAIDPAHAFRRASVLIVVTTVFTNGVWVEPPSAGVAAPGHRLWAARYDGPAGGSDSGQSVAVSPDGTKVFVTGASDQDLSANDDFATVAYAAS